MKKIILTVFLLSSLLGACRKNNGPAVYDLGVDLQENYTEDNVQVYIDGQTLYNNEISTNGLIGLASSIRTTNTEGKHTIKVIVNGEVMANDRFEQHSDLYIGVSFHEADRKIAFRYSPDRFAYN